MKLETFKKRFDFPVIDGLVSAMLQGKNGKFYTITRKNGEFIAKKIEKIKNLGSFGLYNRVVSKAERSKLYQMFRSGRIR